MRIMYLLFSFTIGGTERLVVDICNEMSVRGNEVHLYIVNDMISEELLTTLDKSVCVNLQRRRVGSDDKIGTLLRIANYVKEKEIDVIHCNSFNAPELTIFAKIRSPRVKIIYTVHGLNQYSKLNKVKALLRNVLCSSIIGISQSVVDDIVKYGASKKKTILIYNGIDSKKFDNPSINTNYKVRKISCVARIMPKIKGQDVLIEAAKLLHDGYPNINFEFAGGVAESEQNDYRMLKKRIDECGMDDYVKFIGLIRDISDYYKTVDICVIPSREEGFGLSMVEAMSMGIPCVASDIGGLSEIVNREKIGTLFMCENPEDLASKLKYVIDNYYELKNESLKGKSKIMSDYSIESMCSRLQELYEH